MEAAKLKEQGNELFKQKDYVKALRAYHQANLYLSGLIDKESPFATYSKTVLTDALTDKVNGLKFAIYMNMGQIYINQSKMEKANEILGKAAAIKSTTKLKYRQAIVMVSLGELEKARLLFQQVLAEDPATKPEINEHLAKISLLEKKSNE